MNKHNWKNAPEWANYLAMEADGTWFWYELEPWAEGTCFYSHGKEEALASRSYYYFYTNTDTLEKRP